MNKVLVVVVVPFIEQSYDVWIPIQKKIGVVKQLMKQAVSELSDGNFELSQTSILMNQVTNMVYDDNCFVMNSDIRNGTKLVLL